MISAFFGTVFYNPLYNALIALVAIIPGNDLGFAVISLTLLVKFILAPLMHQSLTLQKKMRDIEPKLKELKEKHPNREEQAVKTMELYREHGINPFAGILGMFIQLPVIFSLYFVTRAGIDLAAPYIYSFTPRPEHINSLFLGSFDLTQTSVLLAALAALTQFVQAQLAIPPVPKAAPGEEPSFKNEFARSMNVQARFILPIFIFFVGLKFTAALALYWITGNLFSIAHELYIRRLALRTQKEA